MPRHPFLYVWGQKGTELPSRVVKKVCNFSLWEQEGGLELSTFSHSFGSPGGRDRHQIHIRVNGSIHDNTVRLSQDQDAFQCSWCGVHITRCGADTCGIWEQEFRKDGGNTHPQSPPVIQNAAPDHPSPEHASQHPDGFFLALDLELVRSLERPVSVREQKSSTAPFSHPACCGRWLCAWFSRQQHQCPLKSLVKQCTYHQNKSRACARKYYVAFLGPCTSRWLRTVHRSCIYYYCFSHSAVSSCYTAQC